MARLRRTVRGKAVRQKRVIVGEQRRHRRASDEPVEQDRHPQVPRRQHRARHGGDLPSAETAQGLEGGAAMPAVQRKRGRHRRGLARQPVIVEPGASPDPVRRLAPEDLRGERGGRRGVADAHLSHEQQFGIRRYRCRTGVERGQAIPLAHGGHAGDVAGRSVKIERHHRKFGPAGRGQRIDRRASGSEVGDHLHRHFGRIGAHPACGDAVVACEDHGADQIGARMFAALPAGHEHRDLLQPAERAQRLGQFRLRARAASVAAASGAGSRASDAAKAAGSAKRIMSR